MDFSLDDLIPIDSSNNVKASLKFKPKLRPGPKPKPKSQPKPISTPTPNPPPPQPVEPAVTAANEIKKRTEEQQPVDAHQISANDGQSSVEKPQQEDHSQNGESFLNVESLNDFLPQSTTVTVNSPPVTETPTIPVSVDENVEKVSIEPDLESLQQIDPLTGEEASIFNDNGDFQIENLSKDAESSLLWDPFDNLSESRTSGGPKVGKFKPKLAQSRKVEHIATISNQDNLSFQYEETIHSVQTDYMDNENVPSFTPDEILSSLDTGINDSIPMETITQMDSVIPETPSLGHENVKNGKRQSSEQSAENEGGRSSERLRRQSKKTLALIDEDIDDDVIQGNEDNHDNNNIDDYRPENENISEKKGRKSKKAVNEKEKPVRKRSKKGSEVQVEPTKVKKKFPHSTRRNRRQVNPELLKIPEDELELHLHNYPMKELIRLAEHRERIAKKEASTSGTPTLNQSGSSLNNIFDEEEAFTQGSGYEHDNSVEAENATYYNYRTHMKITPRMKWTKQDTELFYEAVQQFGTDLSMIKECFPGRTREQIKSKYKKEEKQQPLRLNDALTTRLKGNSHFEDVIKRLKEAQGEDPENEDPITLEGEEENEDPVVTNINEDGEAMKSVESEKKDEEMEGGGSPTKSHDSDDDMYRWSQYKSEI